MEYLGTKVGNGLALGKCYYLDNKLPSMNMEIIHDLDIKHKEIEKSNKAIAESIQDYETIIHSLDSKDLKDLTEFNQMILVSPSIKQEINDKVLEKGYYGDRAIFEYFQNKAKQLEQLDNKYLQERSKDVKDVCDKVLRKYYHIEEFKTENLKEDVILVAYEMTANVLLSKHLEHIKGIVSELGGKTSHVGILSTSLGIPSIFGITNIDKNLKHGELLFVDGNKGIVETELTELKLTQIKEKIAIEQELKKELENVKEAKTIDGFSFEVSANTGDLSELEKINTIPLDGIGLFRTEFLYLNKTKEPTEEYLFEVYKSFVTKMNNKMMIIRTLDIGGDKKCSYIDIKEESNPFLGYRAIRYCLDHEEFFKTSLKAILRASAFGNVAVMYPMISSIEEIRQANIILEKAKNELKQMNIAFDENIKVGVMIEVPAIAIIADMVITEVDFFSIGTNDLVQYTTAVDRGNTVISKLYQWFNPGVIRLIKQVIDSTKSYPNKFVGMCGEMAADPLGIILLVGLGLDEFSVNMHMIKRTKKYISLLSKIETELFVKELLVLKTADEIERRLHQYAESKFGKFY